jgi:DNA-binding winged helix-turn-helix (wHTH) protein/tetratricopeptide (TPR) repeat protein
MLSTEKRQAVFELDLGRYELTRDGRRIKLEKKPMELLIYMLSRKQQLVSRSEIIARLWRSELFIDADPNINNIVRKIRTALSDNSARPRFVETVIGKGYRFIGPVKITGATFVEANPGHLAVHGVQREASGVESVRPTLAVLPLCLLGRAVDDRGICLGLADGLVTRLGNLPGIDVLPLSAVLSLPSEKPPGETGTLLGVRFVVHGAICESKGQWRVSLEMFDTHLGRASVARKCDLDANRLTELEDEFAEQVAAALNRPLRGAVTQSSQRHSKDALAYAEFMRGYRLSSSGDPVLLEEASGHLSAAVARDPTFSLAHATLSLVCASRYFEFDPASVWLEKAEFHCARALELTPDLAEAHLARAVLLWGPSKNFQHLEAIAELRRALSLQKNLPRAYNRLGTILAHIGLLDHAAEMYSRGATFHPRRAVSHSIAQVYIWRQEYDLAEEEIRSWRAELPSNKYALYFAPQVAMMTGEWKQARLRLYEARRLLPDEPLILSLEGLFYALTGKHERALASMNRACVIPRTFGHAHHSYYQISGILAVLGKTKEAFEWLERSVSAGFACWPFFLKDPCLENLRRLPEFEVLISSLQAKYPSHLGLL